MLGALFLYLFGIILTTAGLLFSILAYNNKNNVFFWLGLVFTALVLLGIVLNAEHYYYGLTQSQDPLSYMLVASAIISIVFLALSKGKKKGNDDNVTDSFLDDIINAEDEEWDAAS